MNPRLISNINLSKKILGVAFWGLFITYLTFKMINLTNDKILNYLFLTTAIISICYCGVLAIAAQYQDSGYKKRLIWIAIMYTQLSTLVFLFCHDILETDFQILKINMIISAVLTVILYLHIKIKNGST